MAIVSPVIISCTSGATIWSCRISYTVKWSRKEWLTDSSSIDVRIWLLVLYLDSWPLTSVTRDQISPPIPLSLSFVDDSVCHTVAPTQRQPQHESQCQHQASRQMQAEQRGRVRGYVHSECGGGPTANLIDLCVNIRCAEQSYLREKKCSFRPLRVN